VKYAYTCRYRSHVRLSVRSGIRRKEKWGAVNVKCNDIAGTRVAKGDGRNNVVNHIQVSCCGPLVH
jgi:hypothetical protein